ncbi:MAG: HdeD family acid-resistance protein [Pseudoclavibacter sp.]
MSQSTPIVRFNLNPSLLSPKQVTTLRWVFGIGGAVALILGIVALAFPVKALTAIAWIFGLFFVFSGVLRLVRAIVSKGIPTAWRVFNGVVGLLLVAGGVIALVQPAALIDALGILIAITWIIEGIASLADASPGQSRWFAILSGVLSIIAGLLILLWPAGVVVVMLWIVAFILIIGGVTQLVMAFRFGKNSKTA